MARAANRNVDGMKVDAWLRFIMRYELYMNALGDTESHLFSVITSYNLLQLMNNSSVLKFNDGLSLV
jgi:hypothetical protein